MLVTAPNSSFTDLIAAQPDNGRAAFAAHVREGLRAHPKHLSSQYFYDAEGMRIFQEIMGLPEYYLTGCEDAIFHNERGRIFDAIGPGPLNIVDLGSGDATKTTILLDHCLAERRAVTYFPIDISRDTLRELLAAFERTRPAIPVHAVAAEYFDALDWIKHRHEGRTLVLFLGSNVGNFSPEGSRAFMRHLREALRPGDLALIGFDVKKDPRVITAAYDDAAGVTARFNINLLARINRELGGEFDLASFRHYAYYDEIAGAARSFLMSTRAQTVAVAALHESFAFDAWESIHTEDSWKYSDRDITELAAGAHFDIVRQFTDAGTRFVDSLWRAR